MKDVIQEVKSSNTGTARKILKGLQTLLSAELYEKIAEDWQEQEEVEQETPQINQSTLRPL